MLPVVPLIVIVREVGTPAPLHDEPLAMKFPLASILTQSPLVKVPVVVTIVVVLPEYVPVVMTLLASMTAGREAVSAVMARLPALIVVSALLKVNTGSVPEDKSKVMVLLVPAPPKKVMLLLARSPAMRFLASAEL